MAEKQPSGPVPLGPPWMLRHEGTVKRGMPPGWRHAGWRRCGADHNSSAPLSSGETPFRTCASVSSGAHISMKR